MAVQTDAYQAVQVTPILGMVQDLNQRHRNLDAGHGAAALPSKVHLAYVANTRDEIALMAADTINEARYGLVHMSPCYLLAGVKLLKIFGGLNHVHHHYEICNEVLWIMKLLVATCASVLKWGRVRAALRSGSSVT